VGMLTGDASVNRGRGQRPRPPRSGSSRRERT
jgi:hypothetical protein